MTQKYLGPQETANSKAQICISILPEGELGLVDKVTKSKKCSTTFQVFFINFISHSIHQFLSRIFSTPQWYFYPNHDDRGITHYSSKWDVGGIMPPITLDKVDFSESIDRLYDTSTIHRSFHIEASSFCRPPKRGKHLWIEFDNALLWSAFFISRIFRHQSCNTLISFSTFFNCSIEIS